MWLFSDQATFSSMDSLLPFWPIVFCWFATIRRIQSGTIFPLLGQNLSLLQARDGWSASSPIRPLAMRRKQGSNTYFWTALASGWNSPPIRGSPWSFHQKICNHVVMLFWGLSINFLIGKLPKSVPFFSARAFFIHVSLVWPKVFKPSPVLDNKLPRCVAYESVIHVAFSAFHHGIRIIPPKIRESFFFFFFFLFWIERQNMERRPRIIIS